MLKIIKLNLSDDLLNYLMIIKRLFSRSIYGCCLLMIACSPSPVKEENNTGVVQRIAFGSCASQDRDQPIWENVISHAPDLFLFIGDNIYADTEDMSVMKDKYARLAAKPGYQNLLNTSKVLSVWDDHDYGVNDGDVRYPKKEESEKIFLDFFNVDENSPRRKRPGIYGAEMFGESGKKVQVILLDTRYFKDPQVPNNASTEEKIEQNIIGWYLPTDDTTTTILGEAQWEWLDKQLQKEADLRIIASSIQVISYEKGMESWGNFPHERQRLFNLIEKNNANGVIFISGDVHFSEVSSTNEGAYTFYDFTSSGLTHAGEAGARAVNSYRVGNAYAEPNFGLINIDWSQKNPLITMQTISTDNKVKVEQEIKLSELKVR
jgi:alkaline phosphatase D